MYDSEFVSLAIAAIVGLVILGLAWGACAVVREVVTAIRRAFRHRGPRRKYYSTYCHRCQQPTLACYNEHRELHFLCCGQQPVLQSPHGPKHEARTYDSPRPSSP